LRADGNLIGPSLAISNERRDRCAGRLER